MQLLRKIFSIKNNYETYRKVITVLGLQFELKSSKLKLYKQIKELEIKNTYLNKELKDFKQEIKELINIQNNELIKNNKKIIDSIIELEKILAPNFQNKPSCKNFKKTLPIVYATDENGYSYVYVSILSILKNCNPENLYRFYILTPNQFSTSLKNYFYELVNNYNNAEINFIDMGDFLTDQNMSISHITAPTYYRLKLAEIINEKIALYLDYDTIALSDISEIFETDLTGCYIAGVPAAGYIYNDIIKEKYATWGLDNLSNYINAGVTLWNLDKIRDENLTTTLCSMIKNNYSSQDQDIINIAFKNKIKILPLKYNLMTKYFPFNESNKDYEKIEEIYKKQNIEIALQNPVIVHYADKVKPWFIPNSALSSLWWQIAKETPFFDNYVLKLCSIRNVEKKYKLK